MPEIPRIVLAALPYVSVLSFRSALRCSLCLVLTTFNAGVITFAGTSLYQERAGNPIQSFGVNMLFAVLLGSLARV